LTDPAYNETVARTILADLTKKYQGDVADILIAYNSTPGYVSKFNASGRNPSVLLPETQNYLKRAQRIINQGFSFADPSAIPSARDSAGPAPGSSSSSEVHIDTIVVNTAATDAPGIASSIKGALAKSILADQANTGLH